MDPLLNSRLRPVLRRLRWQALGWRLAGWWSLAALAGLAFLLAHRETGWASAATPVALGLVALAGAIAVLGRVRRAPPDPRAVAGRIERRHPELQGLLLTAVQQPPPADGSPAYLQHRLLHQALAHSRERDWRGAVPRWRVGAALAAQGAALAFLLAVLTGLRGLEREQRGSWAPPGGLVVTPGDASLEKGESLVVLARFGGPLPAGVTLVVRTSGQAPRQIPLVRSLADPVFGASIPEVDQNLAYHLEYGGRSTREFQISVYEHPRLDRADATLTYPAYTHLAPRRIEDTRRVSAVEGTRLDLALQLNKPVASAALVAHDGKQTVIPLEVAADRAVAALPRFPLVASQTYDLRLTDREGRANRPSAPFVIEVLPDRPPELHLATPRGDVRVSAVEEIHFTGTLLGQFGVPAYGLAYTLAGGETRTIELGRGVPPMEKRAFDTVLSLEDLGVRPDQLISWYLWADDTGPDGRPRRTPGDLYFAEIRPFDEVFREDKGQDSPDQDPAGGGPGGESQRLTELEKQIVTATWKLQRDPAEPKYAADAGVVRDAQEQALTQAAAGAKATEDPRTQAFWGAATRSMQEALTHLRTAASSAAALAPALAAEQSAYQALLRLQARQTLVSRGKGRGGRGGASQAQLDQLDLTQDQNRYETQRQASAAETPARREQLQVMNRLQELARRQQDVNDRLKEMQTALQEAKTEQARDEIRRQLRRLEDEQQQMLADVDELQQRMDRQENQAAMSDQRRQLDQTRQDLQRSAAAAGQGSVPEALAAGTRAQRQLQEMHDELHRQNSSQFADDLREMRAAARTLAEQEDAVARTLGQASPRKSLTDAPGAGSPAEALDRQQARMTELVNRAKQVSQQAETSEPILADKLYDSLRRLTQADAGTVKEFQQQLLASGLMTRSLYDRLNDETAPEGTKSLGLTADLLREGYPTQAAAAERRARDGINQLKDGLEAAAESVIGDDAEALRLARAELDGVTDELRHEAGADPGGADRDGAVTEAEKAVRLHPDDAEARARLGGALARLGRAAEAAAQFQRALQLDPLSPAARAGLDRLAASGTPGPSSPGSPGGPPPEAGAPGSAPDQGSPGATATGGNPPGAGGRQPGASGDGQTPPRLAGGPARNGAGAGGDAGEPPALDRLLGGGGGRGAPAGGGPITGGNYGAWADRLRDVEEVVDSPELRNTVATARERARLLRQDYMRNLKKPDWAVIQRDVIDPLTEVRNRINDELARRGSRDSLVPIDRDPVPDRYAESVRKYYEELGKDQ
jgi:hypothetical protein